MKNMMESYIFSSPTSFFGYQTSHALHCTSISELGVTLKVCLSPAVLESTLLKYSSKVLQVQIWAYFLFSEGELLYLLLHTTYVLLWMKLPAYTSKASNRLV